jgi:hypothetical protein
MYFFQQGCAHRVAREDRLRRPECVRSRNGLGFSASCNEEGDLILTSAFTTAIVTAVGAVAVTLDPESVYFVGRLSPLVDEVLPEARRRLTQSLPVAPEIRVAAQVIGLSWPGERRMPE